MTVAYLGSLSTAQIAPGVAAPLAAMVGELQVQASAMASAQLAISPGGVSFAAQIEALADIATKLAAAAALGLTPPSVSFAGEALLAIKAKLAALLELQSSMQAAGIHALSYTGRASELGGEVEGAISDLSGVQPSDTADALILVATTPAAIQALRTIFVG